MSNQTEQKSSFSDNKADRDSHYQKVYRADRWARRMITAGGYGIIISISAILLFLLYQSLPLAKSASVEEVFSIPAGSAESRVLLTGIDAYQEVGYMLDENGLIRFYRLKDNQPLMEKQLSLVGNERILSAVKGNLTREVFAVGTDSGRVITAEIEMTPKYSQTAAREIVPAFEELETWQTPPAADSSKTQIVGLSFVQNEDLSRFWAYVDQNNDLHLRIYDADDEEEFFHDSFNKKIDGARITAITASHNGENLVIGHRNGNLQWYDISDYETIQLKDEWQSDNQQITALGYLLGDQALAIGTAAGSVEVWFPVRTPNNLFKFQKIHTFTSHQNPVTIMEMSSRNRNFLTIDSHGAAKLHYATSGQTQLSFLESENPVSASAFSPKSNGIVLVDQKHRFSFYALDNPHPETTAKTLFGKVWYEGYPQPEFVWQSTGGSDEFEPKLSLIPVIFGTLKGTIYAMLFSIPLAILAAVYVSQFSPDWMARMVKPTVEIMAALPSVVIGFLAGLYFSPVFEDHLMTVMLFTFWLPVAFALGVFVWWMIPEDRRVKIPAGWEMAFMVPFVLLAYWLSYNFGTTMEGWFFAGNFQQWLYSSFNITYETRNSLIVGFALGFAVIPIIFTVAEDSLANVPKSLTSASLALGASRWQTVRRVVLPAASGGIFAAIMLGLGRAVGETMIVLMATGNTPILDISPFNGFRAMSANIAVEIPEAPVGGTLYRVLFFTALLLFLFTFVLNTVSSLIGDRLRKKYARF